MLNIKNKSKIYLKLFISFLLVNFNFSLAKADDIPSTVDPAHIEKSITKQDLFTDDSYIPEIEVKPFKEDVPEGAEKIRFVLKKIEIEGATAYKIGRAHV